MSKKAYIIPTTCLLSLAIPLMLNTGSQHTEESLSREEIDFEEDDLDNLSRRNINVWEDEEEEDVINN